MDQPFTVHKSHTGFTLIELLVVVSIIGILAAIAIPNFLEAQTRAKVARAKAEMRSLAMAVELYNIDWNAYPFVCRMNYGNTIYGDDFYCNFMCYDPGDEEAQLSPEGTMCPNNLTTPVAYLAAPPPRDPFIGKMGTEKAGSAYGSLQLRRNLSYFFYNFKLWAKHRHRIWAVAPAPMRFNGPDGPVYPANWALLSPGPDCTFAVKRPNAALPWVSTTITSWVYPDQWEGLLEGRHSLYDPSNGTVSAGDIWRTNQGSIP